MAAPSSTSSSEPRRLPWGGLLAVVLVLLTDQLLFDALAPWEALRARMAADDHMELGVALDRQSFEQLHAAADDGPPQVALLGSSRAGRGLLNYMLDEPPLEHVEYLRFCHAGLNPFELRALTAELAEDPPDAAVVVLSEFDTHRPVRLQTQLGAGSLEATLELADAAGWAFAWEQRDAFLGLALASALDAYRYRALWGAAGLSTWRRFVPARQTRKRELINAPYVLEGEPPQPLNIAKAVDALGAFFPQLTPTLVRAQLQQLRSVTRGPHAEVQMALMDRMVRDLRDAGVKLVVVEGPVHPAADHLADPAPREEFRALARTWDALDGVRVLWLEETGPFRPSVWGDLTHLDEPGSMQLAEHVRPALAELLGIR